MNPVNLQAKFDNLKELVTPLSKNFPYYRPFVCKGADSYDIFLVGINPATPISQDELKIDEYVRLLMNHEEFYKKYEELRERSGKKNVSRTRMGIQSFVNELEITIEAPILETNVIPIPMANVKELKQVPTDVIEHSKDVFFRVLLKYRPKVIILYSKFSLYHLVDLLDKQ